MNITDKNDISNNEIVEQTNKPSPSPKDELIITIKEWIKNTRLIINSCNTLSWFGKVSLVPYEKFSLLRFSKS